MALEINVCSSNDFSNTNKLPLRLIRARKQVVIVDEGEGLNECEGGI